KRRMVGAAVRLAQGFDDELGCGVAVLSVGRPDLVVRFEICGLKLPVGRSGKRLTIMQSADRPDRALAECLKSVRVKREPRPRQLHARVETKLVELIDE